MKYLNAVMTVVAILLTMLVLKVYIFPDSIYEKVGENPAEQTYLNKRSGRLYVYSPKYLQYPGSIKVIDLKSCKEKEHFIKN